MTIVYHLFQTTMCDQNESLCVNCDILEIRKEATQKATDRAIEYNLENPASKEEEKSEEDFFDECLSELYAEYGMCRRCYDEDHADDWDED